MPRMLLLVLGALWGGIAAVAQPVSFRNTDLFTTPADRRVYAVDGTPLVGTHFVAQLYYGTSASSLSPVTGSPRPFRDVPTTDTLAGTWVGATRTLTGMTLGTVVTLQVRAWDASGGVSLDEARLLGRHWGESATFTYQILTAGGPPDLFYMDNFRAFTLVPEPSVFGLALAGAGALFLLMRRK